MGSWIELPRVSRDRPKIERYGRAAQDALEATHYSVYGLAVEGASRDLDPECWIRWDLPASPRIGSAHPFGHRHMAELGLQTAQILLPFYDLAGLFRFAQQLRSSSTASPLCFII